MKEGAFRRSEEKITLIDIPGTYSLSAYTMEELVAREVIIKGNADLIINVLDATNLERNLYLGIQLMEIGRPMVFAFNMSDELHQSGARVDIEALSRLLGIPICFTVGRTGEGVRELVDTAVAAVKGNDGVAREVQVHYGAELESALGHLVALFDRCGFDAEGIAPRWWALKLLEGDEEIIRQLQESGNNELLSALDATTGRLSIFLAKMPQP